MLAADVTALSCDFPPRVAATAPPVTAPPASATIAIHLELLDFVTGKVLATATSDAGGNYTFKVVQPGSYIVREVRQPGRIQTFPDPPGTHVVTSLSGLNIRGQDFGNLPDANHSFVYQSYLDLLHRRVEVAGLASWSGFLDSGASRADVVRGIEGSVEYRTKVIEKLYRSLLGRGVDPRGLTGGMLLLSGTPSMGGVDLVTRLKAIILGSEEYLLVRGGGTNAGFLSAVYHDLFGRDVDPTGALAFGAALAQGASRTTIAETILLSVEAQQDLVQGYYQLFLGRQGDLGGLNAWVDSLRHGATSGDVIVAFVASDEFFGAL